MTWVDHEVRVLVIFPKIELLPRRAPPIFFLHIDWKAKVVKNVERLVALITLVTHDEQVVVRAHVQYLRLICDCLASLQSLFLRVKLLPAELVVNLVPDSVPLWWVRQHPFWLFLELFHRSQIDHLRKGTPQLSWRLHDPGYSSVSYKPGLRRGRIIHPTAPHRACWWHIFLEVAFCWLLLCVKRWWKHQV